MENTTIFVVITIIIMMIVIFGVIGVVIYDNIKYTQWKKHLAERDAKQKKLNDLVKGLRYSLSGGRRGFIRCEYAFGRFYICYECITDTGEHYSITESFYESGIAWENYSRVGTKYGFHKVTDGYIFAEVKEDMLSIIHNIK